MSALGVDILVFYGIGVLLFGSVASASAKQVSKKLKTSMDRQALQRENYERERRIVSEQLEKVFNEIIDGTNNIPIAFKNTQELVSCIDSLRMRILDDFTFEAFKSPTKLTEIQSEIQRYFRLASDIDQFIKILQKEESFGLDLHTLDALIKLVPSECTKLREELLNFKEIAVKAERTLKSEECDKQKLEELLQTTPIEFKELRNRISKRLLQLGRLKKVEASSIVKTQHSVRFGKAERKKMLLEEARNSAFVYYNKLTKISSEEAQKVKPLVEEIEKVEDINRVEILLDEIKLRYVRAREEYLKSEQLKEKIKHAYIAVPMPQVREEAERLLSKELVREDEYEEFINKVVSLGIETLENYQKMKRKAAEIVSKKLSDEGYSTLNEDLMDRLLQGDVVELKTPYGDDYALRVKLTDETLAVRFIRYVDSLENLSEYERQKDIEIGKKWCKTYEELRQILKQNGLLITNKHRIEPEEKFYYEKRAESQEQQKKAQQKIVQKNEQARRMSE